MIGGAITAVLIFAIALWALQNGEAIVIFFKLLFYAAVIIAAGLWLYSALYTHNNPQVGERWQFILSAVKDA